MDKSRQEGILNSIRKEFFSLRNGMIADTLRKGGLEQKYIFGLQLPQIKDTAERFRPEEESEAASIARILWSDKDCREARLLACHIMPLTQITRDEAVIWCNEVGTREEADILAFRLLRHLPYASEIAKMLSDSSSQLKKYTSTAIQRFL